MGASAVVGVVVGLAGLAGLAGASVWPNSTAGGVHRFLTFDSGIAATDLNASSLAGYDFVWGSSGGDVSDPFPSHRIACRRACLVATPRHAATLSPVDYMRSTWSFILGGRPVAAGCQVPCVTDGDVLLYPVRLGAERLRVTGVVAADPPFVGALQVRPGDPGLVRQAGWP